MSHFKLSPFGERLCSPSGIVSLMHDLGEALNVNPNLLFLGGGNPAGIPQVEAALADELTRVAQDADRLHKLIGVYQSPRGHEGFISQWVDYLNRTCGWTITERNVAMSNGSQSAFFLLMNMLAAPADQGRGAKKIHLPMAPEYLGYCDQPIYENMFTAHRPVIVEQGEHGFHYSVDLDSLQMVKDAAAYCVSMPTNPTGNVLEPSELKALQVLAEEHGVPLIVDCAYGAPIPGIVYGDVELPWSESSVFMFSLSKLGLPGTRTGIVVGPEGLIEQFVSANTVASLANGNLGPVLVESLMERNELEPLIQDVVQPFYRGKRDFMLEALGRELEGVPYRIHRADGAFFLWLWLSDLPVPSQTLYALLKEEGVLVMPGEPFFFGLSEPWSHASECIRLSYCQSDAVLAQAVEVLGGVLRRLYGLER